jgi:hypothetical protein
LASASIRKFCGQAALTAVIVFGGLVMGAVTPAYSDETSTAGAGGGDSAAP